ncbi:MAG: FecR domain-containing protein [Elusimicrobia bacterium]|nr:FecR domain-containing protein [Elusimicrobiota bacterium]
MNHEALQDLLAPYALGTVPPGERSALDAHLASGCEDCRRALLDFQAVTQALPLSVTAEEPPARVKTRLMSRVLARPRFPWYRNLALAASVLLLAGLAGVWLRRQAAGSWKVVSVTGQLLADGRPVQIGAAIRPGQLLATSEDVEADVRLGDQAVFRLKPSSEAVPVRKEGGVLVRLQKGGLLGIVKTGAKFSVKTAVATAAVRGTVLYIQVDSAEKTYACICTGRLHLEADALSQDMEADHHKAVELSPDGGRVKAAPAAMRDHTDEDIESLAARFQPSR